jgi:hypothetical protein
MGSEINIKKRIDVKEEGVSITPDVNSINFVGDGVTASAVGDDVTVNIPGGQGTTTYYLNETIAQAPYKEFSSISSGAVQQSIVTSVAAGATATIQSFQTASGVPGTTNIPGGLWSFYLHFSGTPGDTWSIFAEVYVRDLGGIETLLLTTDATATSTLAVTPAMFLTDGVFPASTVLTTDRIVVKVKVTNTDSTTNSITFYTEGSTNYSVSITTLNQVVPTGAVTNVTGTAPIASSGGTTPAISISQSSAVSDGYLSSTDWTTFNNKLSQAYTTVEDEGTPLTQRSTINFVGAGVTATDSGGKTVVTIAGASGRFGIADSNGAYTYYTTLSLAMAAATGNQTIEMFTDYTESGVVAITLKDGVTINGNGHSYIYSAPSGNCFIDNGVAITANIYNLTILRSGASSGSVYVQTSSNSDTTWTGSKIYMVGGTASEAVSLVGTIRNIWVKTTTSTNAISSAYTSNAKLYNSYGESSSGYGLILRTSRVYNCTSISVSSGAYLDQSLVFNSILQSTSGDAVLYGSLYNCTAISTSGKGIDRASAFNSTILSTSGVAVSAQVNIYHNCVIRSSSANAVNGVADIYNSSIYTDTASVTSGLTGISNYYNCSLRTNWNNVSGHLLTTIYAPSCELVNNFMQVANTSAYILTASAAGSVKYSNNAYKGATTPINTAVITQGIVNTQDNQGNILL